MTNPTVTQADRDAAASFGHGFSADERLIRAFAAHRELGKSEGYAQAVDDAVAVAREWDENSPYSSRADAIAALRPHPAGAVKDRTNG